MQVEVSVQDGFYGDRPDPAPIAEQEWESWIDRWLTQLDPRDEAGDRLHPQAAYELSLRLTDDAEIQTLNRDFRAKDQPTDVLSFAALEVETPDLPEEEPLYLGDILISVETAARQAEQQGHSLRTELAWLAAHGLLHLLGWDHPDEDSLVRMLDQQQVLLQMVDLQVSMV